MTMVMLFLFRSRFFIAIETILGYFKVNTIHDFPKRGFRTSLDLSTADTVFFGNLRDFLRFIPMFTIICV